MTFDHVFPRGVAEPRRFRGRPDDVREQHGRECPVDHRLLGAERLHERLGRVEDLVHVAGLGHLVEPRHLEVLRARDPIGEVAGRGQAVAPRATEHEGRGTCTLPRTSRTSVPYHTSSNSSAAAGEAACRWSLAHQRM
jgi:hypothetical protein